MIGEPDTIQVFVPLKVKKKNGRPKLLPPADYLPSEDQTQDPHILARHRSRLELAAALGGWRVRHGA